MLFASPHQMNWLWLLIPIGIFIFLTAHRRQKLLRRFVAENLLSEIAIGGNTQRRGLKYCLFLAAIIFSFLAVARPQWGYEMREVKREGLDILVVMDTSRSMLSEDIKPNRFERAKLAVKDFLKQLRGDRIGLIAFSGDAFLVCPLTVDYGGFVLSLDDLDMQTIPRGGTNIASAIREAIREYDNTPSKYKAVILITDGENLEENPEQMITEARRKGIKIYTIGVGTKAGELIKVKDLFGQETYVKDAQENIIKSRLNEKLLEQIALQTGGVYIRAGGGKFGLDLIYNKQLSKMERRDIGGKLEKDYVERFQIPLVIAFVFLLLEFFTPFEAMQGKREAS